MLQCGPAVCRKGEPHIAGQNDSTVTHLKLAPESGPKKASLSLMIGVGLFGVAIGFNAASLDPFIFSEKVRLLAPMGMKNTLLGLITILALLTALLVQPVVGQWSDRTRSRWGKRVPYLVAGAVGLSSALALIVLADSLGWLILGAMLMSMFANTTQATWQALIPDHIPGFQHGTAAGVKTVLELIGVVSGVAVVGYFLLMGNVWAAPLITSLLFLAILGVTLAVIRGRPVLAAAKAAPRATPNPLAGMISGVRNSPPAFLWWMLNRILFWSAAISIRTFILNYLEDTFGMSPAEAEALSSQILILLGLGVFVLALPAGAVADRIGRRPILVVAGVMAAAGAGMMVFLHQLTALYVAGALIAVAAGIFAGPSWALATNLAPENEGALYLGLANGATVVGSMSGRLGGVLIDGVNQLSGTVGLGYVVDFGIAALFFAASSLVALKIKIPESRNQKSH